MQNSFLKFRAVSNPCGSWQRHFIKPLGFVRTEVVLEPNGSVQANLVRGHALPVRKRRARQRSARLTAGGVIGNPDATKSGLDWIGEKSVELREGSEDAISADEPSRPKHLFGTQLEAWHLGREFAFLLTHRCGGRDGGHATTELACRGFQPVNVGLELLAGNSLGKSVMQPNGGLRGACFSLLGLFNPKFQPGTRIGGIDCPRFVVDAPAAEAAEPEDKNHHQVPCRAPRQLRNAALTSRVHPG